MTKAQTLTPFERALMLRAFPPFAHIAASILVELAHHSREDRFGRGKRILEAGAGHDALVLLVDGQALVTGTEHDGEVLDATIPLAPMSFFANTGEDTEAKALDDVVTLAVDRLTIEEAIFEEPTLARATISFLASAARVAQARSLGGAHIATSSATSNLGEDSDWPPRVRALRASGIFSAGNVAAHLELAPLLRPIDLSSGTTLWRVGEPSGDALLIASGRIEGTGEGDLQFSAGPGFQAGLLESLCDQPRWYEARAETPLAGFRLSRTSVLNLVAENPHHLLDLVSLLATRALEPTLWQQPSAERPRHTPSDETGVL